MIGFSDFKKILKISSLSVFFVFIVVYAFYRSYNLISGVKIKNVNIENGAKLEKSLLEISGNAKNALKLSLNDREVSIDEEGNFKDSVALLLGYNVVKIRAEDKFGYVDEKNYQLIYAPKTTE